MLIGCWVLRDETDKSKEMRATRLAQETGAICATSVSLGETHTVNHLRASPSRPALRVLFDHLFSGRLLLCDHHCLRCSHWNADSHLQWASAQFAARSSRCLQEVPITDTVARLLFSKKSRPSSHFNWLFVLSFVNEKPKNDLS